MHSTFIKASIAAAMVWGGVSAAQCGDGSAESVFPAYRSAFVRGESNAVFRVGIANTASDALCDVEIKAVQLGLKGERVSESLLKTGKIEPGAVFEAGVKLETRLVPGWRKLEVSVKARKADGTAAEFKRQLDYGIGPAHGDRMVTQMWHYSKPGTDNPEREVADFGFSHAYNNFNFKGMATMSPEWKKDQMQRLDRAVMSGLMLTGGVIARYPVEGKHRDRFMRKGRDGKTVLKQVGKIKRSQPEVGNPEMVAHIRKFTDAEAEFLSPHTGFAGALLITENRDHTFPSFGGEAKRYKAETGREIPDTVTNKTYNLQLAQARFPDGAVPDDDEIYSYYSWFWRGGDGWPGYISAAAEAFNRRLDPADENYFTFWDPAVRCPPIWGAPKKVQMLNQWCYANPEPLNVAGPAEEMLAMTSGTPGQRTSIMTQLICYRIQLAPKGITPAEQPQWFSRTPDANFITIAPDVLSEATWSMIAKPVDAIMYHGWGTVFETGEKKSYVFTNGESAKRLKSLFADVINPLGPVLKRLGREKPRVAVLESFTTVALGGGGSWGWTAPSVTFMQRARLDPCVVYEDMIRRGDLKDIKLLYAPQCRFLPKSVIAEIRKFQARGGLLIADERLTSALKADIAVPLVSFAPPPASDLVAGMEEYERSNKDDNRQRATRRAKARMVAQSEDLRKALASRYRGVSDSSSPDIVVFNRKDRSADYVFAINDRRTFGDYVGMWGRQMEKGLPCSGWVSLNGAAGRVGAVYELSRGVSVPFERAGDDVRVKVDFETTDGRMLMFLPRPIASVKAAASAEVAPGGKIEASFRVMDSSGAPVDALLPVEIRVYDAAGRELDGAGYACAVGGTAKISLVTNLDDASGDYRIVCRDRASGLEDAVTVRRAGCSWWKRIFK